MNKQCARLLKAIKHFCPDGVRLEYDDSDRELRGHKPWSAQAYHVDKTVEGQTLQEVLEKLFDQVRTL